MMTHSFPEPSLGEVKKMSHFKAASASSHDLLLTIRLYSGAVHFSAVPIIVNVIVSFGLYDTLKDGSYLLQTHTQLVPILA